MSRETLSLLVFCFPWLPPGQSSFPLVISRLAVLNKSYDKGLRDYHQRQERPPASLCINPPPYGHNAVKLPPAWLAPELAIALCPTAKRKACYFGSIRPCFISSAPTARAMSSTTSRVVPGLKVSLVPDQISFSGFKA